MKSKPMKKAFTLAEIMIVLTIIGVLTAILLPIANHSRPDEAVMKFKKADTTLKNVIRELVNSDKYYLNGDLAKRKRSMGFFAIAQNDINKKGENMTKKEQFAMKLGIISLCMMIISSIISILLTCPSYIYFIKNLFNF